MNAFHDAGAAAVYRRAGTVTPIVEAAYTNPVHVEATVANRSSLEEGGNQEHSIYPVFVRGINPGTGFLRREIGGDDAAAASCGKFDANRSDAVPFDRIPVRHDKRRCTGTDDSETVSSRLRCERLT